MKITIKTILIVFMLTVSTFSQEEGTVANVVSWSSDSTCEGDPAKKPKGVICDSFVYQGEKVYIIQDRGIFVAASFTVQSRYLVVDVYVSNDSDQRILVDPENWVNVTANVKKDPDLKKTLREEYSANPYKIADKVIRSHLKNSLINFADGTTRRINR